MSASSPAPYDAPCADLRAAPPAHHRRSSPRSFKGDIIGPDHPEYEEDRLVWNAMIDRQSRPDPALHQPPLYVVAAVNVAREHGLPPSVRCGGPNVAGKAMSDGGLTIDLSGLREVTVDPGAQAGPRGRRLPARPRSTRRPRPAPAAGRPGRHHVRDRRGRRCLALGGGIGWFSRKHGLTCDQFASLELVLASGEVIEVSGTQHPGLFWALRGGGGNFGIVTRLTFGAHDFGPMMRIGVSVYEPEQAAAALRSYANVVQTLPTPAPRSSTTCRPARSSRPGTSAAAC